MDMKTHTFRIPMTCEGCSGAVEKVLNKKKGDGVDTIEVSLKDQTVKVTASLPSDELINILKKTGKSVELISSS